MAENRRVRILFFGSLGERLGREREIEIPDGGCTIAELRARLPELAGAIARACIDREVAAEDARVLPGQEVAFVPPLSGG